MHKLWNFISEIGIQQDLSIKEKKLIRVSNRLGLIISLLSIPHFFTYLEANAYNIAFIQIITTVILASSLLSNYFHFYLLAKMTIPIAGTINVFITSSALGFESGEHIAFLAISLFSLMLFDFKEYIFIGINYSLIILSIFLLEYTDYSLLTIENLHELDRSNYTINFLATFFTNIFIAYYFLNYSNRQFNELLIKTKEQLQSVFDHSFDAIFVVDLTSFSIIACNSRSLTMFDATEKNELLSISLRDLRQPDFTIRELDGFQLKKPLTDEFEYISQIGRRFWGSVAYTYIQYDDQARLLVRISDVSQKKAFEEALIQAKVNAEAADRAKTLFLANMSHELRTPINGIIGLSEIIEEEYKENEELFSYASLLKESGERLQNTIETILDLSHLEGNLINLNLEVVCINELVEEICEDFVPLAEQKNLSISWQRPQEDFFLKIDENLTRKILRNLIDNAIKFTEDGSIEINYHDHIDFDNKQAYLSIIISDTGIGMSENFARHRLFKEFVQESEGFDRTYEGSGIGLALVQKFTLMMQGKISVESKKNVGSKFKLTFPLIKSSQ